MEKYDIKKEFPLLYNGRKADPYFVEMPAHHALMVAGEGGPQTEFFQDAMKALYGITYAYKFASKAAGRDFVVPPSGAEWWMKDGTPLDEARQEEWRWEFEMPLPPWTRAEDIEEAKEAWCAKKKRAIGSLPAMRYRKIAARQIGRILHIGPYNEAEEWWARLQEHISAHKMRSEGNTHEIYLNDPERVVPEMIKTILWCEVVTVA